MAKIDINDIKCSYNIETAMEEIKRNAPPRTVPELFKLIDTVPFAYQYFSLQERSNEKVTSKALDKNPAMINLVPYSTLSSKEEIYKLICTKPKIIPYLNNQVINTYRLVVAAIHNNPNLKDYVSQAMWYQDAFLREVITYDLNIETPFARVNHILRLSKERKLANASNPMNRVQKLFKRKIENSGWLY